MFQSSVFTFDDISSSEMEVILVSTNSGVLEEHSIGYNVNATIDMAGSLEGYLYGVEYDVPSTIDITIALVDKVGNPKRWTVEERLRVFSWLVKDDYRPFVSEDDKEVVYYFKCVGIKKEFNGNLEGLVTLTMQPSSPFAYTPIINYNYCNIVGREHIVHIANISNVDKHYYPCVRIVNQDEKGKIEIKNKETGVVFTIENLELDEVVDIDMQLKHITSSLGKNRLIDSNMNWIGLNTGENTLILSGVADFNIQCQFPLLI